MNCRRFQAKGLVLRVVCFWAVLFLPMFLTVGQIWAGPAMLLGSKGSNLSGLEDSFWIYGSVYKGSVIFVSNQINGPGVAVEGHATYTGDVANYGGYFLASGEAGYGVYGRASSESSTSKNYGGYFMAKGGHGSGVYGEATGSLGRGVYGLASNTGNVVNYGGYFSAHGSAGHGVYGEATGTIGVGVKGTATGTKSTGVYGSGKLYDFYAGGDGANYAPFTGAHDVCLAKDMEVRMRPGMIVVCTGRVAVRKGENGKLCLSSTLPTVTLATRAADKKIFGVLVQKCPFPEDHWYKALEGEHLGVVNALGEGLVWVCNINGEIGAGDYITSSPAAGYGQLQNDDLVHSYTLGKATADVDWDKVTETIDFNGRKVKIYLLPVVYTSG